MSNLNFKSIGTVIGVFVSGPLFASGEGGEHGASTTPLFFVIFALIIGAATRHLLKKSPVPFTVLLFIFGLALGAFARFGPGEIDIAITSIRTAPVTDALSWAAHIDPHLLLYIFLPILIFEAAFSMDTHTFRKSISNALILAVPGILIALFLTAAIALGMQAIGLGLDGWNWPIALMFGAVVSATDPVAVVSILKELGANKKLGTLIEGESLLNDGTAIVIFMVFLGAATGVEAELSPFVQFIKVAAGGVVIGWLFGRFVNYWIKKVFNDALVEISLIVAASYLTFYVAEHFFHVSGVLALVTLGVIMASSGRTKISPAVEHFLHEFWELAAFISNTLIFLIVGIVIAIRVNFTPDQLLNLLLLYIGIHVVRALIIATLYPIMTRLGYGISKKYAYVLWWGALRGAIGLALTLIVAEESALDPTVRDEFLFLTSGVIMLTLVVNATTMKWFVAKLGLTKDKPIKQLMLQEVNATIGSSIEKTVGKLKKDRYLRGVDWDVVNEFIPKNDGNISSIPVEQEIVVSEMRRRVLLKEKDSYWRQFKNGTIHPSSVVLLSNEIDIMLDADGKTPLSDRKDIEDNWRISKWAVALQNWPLIGRYFKNKFYEQLAISYGCASGMIVAQDDALKLLSNMVLSKGEGIDNEELEIFNTLENEINTNKLLGLTFLRNLRNTYPKMYASLMTNQAIHSILNSEKKTIDRLYSRGRITEGEYASFRSNIKSRFQKLSYRTNTAHNTESTAILKSVPWLASANDEIIADLAKIASHKVVSPGEKLIHQSSKNDRLVYIISTGTVEVWVDDKNVDLLGPGEIVGEVRMLTKVARSADIVAQTPVTALVMRENSLQDVLKKHPIIESSLWVLIGTRLGENILSNHHPYDNWSMSKLKSFLKTGHVSGRKELENYSVHNLYILIAGSIHYKDSYKMDAPVLIDTEQEHDFSDDAKVFVLPLISRMEY